MIEPVIRTILAADAAVSAKVADRVYLGPGPQNERRARICLTLLSSPLPYTFDGPSDYRSGTMQAACLAPTYREAHDLAEAVVAALNNIEPPGPSGLVLHYVEPTDIEEIEAQPLEGQAQPTFGRAIPIDFQHEV